MNHPYADLPLLVVSGIGRSGTTALRRALGAHPEIHSTGTENNIIHDVIAAAHRNKTLESRRVAMRVPEPEYDARFRALLLDLLWPEPRTETRALLAYSFLTPEIAGALFDVLPCARIAYIVRNGIEVVASRTLYASFAQQEFAHHCRLWSGALDFDRWSAAENRSLVVRHEHLLNAMDAEQTLGDACSLVGLGLHGSVVDALGSNHHPTRHDSDQSDVLTRRVERWHTWTPEQQNVFWKICAAAMSHFDYEVPAVQAAA